MCYKTVKEDPWDLFYVFNHFKAKKMCDAAVSDDSFSFQYAPDSFVTQGQLKYGVMTMVIAIMMMALKHSIMAIENVRPRRHK